MNNVAPSLDRHALFRLSCIALTVTSMTFAIRAGMLTQLGTQFGLSGEQLGWIASMAFFGFPVATIVGGLVYNAVGPRNLMIIAALAHITGFILTIFSDGFWDLMVSTFLVGFANGAVEAACNPMIAKLFPENRTTMLNKFHVWFPGGIVIGSLLALLIQHIGAENGLVSTWQFEITVMLPVALVYGLLIFRLEWPSTGQADVPANRTADNIRALFTPLFIITCLLMTVTATVELGTQQWVGPLLSASGAQPLVVLAIVTGLMAVGRYFAGPLVNRLGVTGLLLLSAAVSAAGIAGLSVATGALVYLAAIVFAVGVCYFWPTMLGLISEYAPNTGALGLSLVGGVGMFGLALWQPVIGAWLDAGKRQAMAAGMAESQIDLFAGQQVLQKLLFMPLGLVVVFAVLFVLLRRSIRT